MYLQPILSLVLALTLAAAILAFRGRNRAAARAACLAAGVLFFFSWPPSAALFAWTLEAPFDVHALPPGDVQALVVLSATIHAPDPPHPFRILSHQTYLRCASAVWLYHHWRRLPIVVSGGRDGVITLAGEMAVFLRTQGVAPEHIWLEDRSQSTHENARFSAEVLRARGIRHIALVTEAYHMQRAQRCFRREGLQVSTAPCGFRHLQLQWRWAQLIPSPALLRSSEDVLHEWVALGTYRLRGWL